MTERTASGRALGALKAIGMDETPVSVLERDDALFVLTPQTLVYQDGGGTRRVTLRDLTRIHSDEQGVLRVETPAGTALTATLLGFDVTQVQAFFMQVRDTTAGAKDQQTSPLPTADGLKTFGASPPASASGTGESATRTMPTVTPPIDGPAAVRPPAVTGAVATPAPPATVPPRMNPAMPGSAAPPPRPTIRPEAGVLPSKTSTALEPSAAEHGPAQISAPNTFRPPAPRPDPTVVPGSAPSADARPTLPGTSRPVSEAPAVRPVVISSSTFTPSAARTPMATPEPARGPERAAESVVRSPAPPPAPATPVAASPAQPSSVQPSSAQASAVQASPAPDMLARQADVVEGLTGRLRFLGGVLFVAALALAAVQFTSGARLDGLWTLLSGGVGTIALLALAELARLLALSARHRPADGRDDR